MRWPGTDGIFSAVKRKLGGSCTIRSTVGLEAEGYQMFWVFYCINQGKNGDRRDRLGPEKVGQE